MNIDYTVTALMFPAIPLLMSVYSNRFHSLSILIRQLHDEHVYEKHIPPEWKKQFINLSGRITLLRWTILFASFGFLFNMLTVFALYFDEVFLARLIFGSCCLSMIVSILFFIREIHISTNALKLHMSDMDVDVLSNPDQVAEDKTVALMSAIWFWNKNKLNQYADSGDIKTMTKRINGGTIGLEDRKKHYEHALHVLGAH